MRYRDQTMAENLLWWKAHVPGRIVFSSSNTHIGYRTDNPDLFPLAAGNALREAIGTDYVAIGSTIGSGAINALPGPTSARPRTYRVPEPAAGTSERTLIRLRGDRIIDLRQLPPEATRWAGTTRPVRNYGLYWSDQAPSMSLADSYDAIVHQHTITPGRCRLP